MNNVKGVGEVIKALEAVGANIKSQELQQMLRGESQRIVDTAKSLVPVDTGDLRESIGFITNKDDANMDKVLIGVRKSYHNYYLAPMLEYGTEPRVTKSGAYRGVLKPRPFMRPALDKNRDAVVNGVNRGVSKIVLKLAEKFKLK